MDLLIINEKTPDRNYVILADNKINKITAGLKNLVEKIHIVCDENYYRKSSLTGIIFHPVKNFKKHGVKNTLLRLLYHLLFIIRLFRKAVTVIKHNPQIKFIINISGHFTIGLVNILTGRITGRRSLLRLTESIQVAFLVNRKKGSLSRLVNWLSYTLAVILEKIVFKFSHKIISVTPLEYYPNIKGFESKTVFIPDIIQETCVNDTGKDAEKKILFAGRLELEKNPFTLLKCISEISKNRRDFKTLIIGGGELEKPIRNFIERNKLGRVAELIPTMKHEQLINLLKTSYLLVNTSYLELMPNIIVEALACGLPVIAPRLGGIPYLIHPGYNGFLYKTGDVKTLGDLINKLLDNEDLRDKMSSNCKKFFREIFEKDFGDRAVHNRYERIIRE